MFVIIGCMLIMNGETEICWSHRPCSRPVKSETFNLAVDPLLSSSSAAPAVAPQRLGSERLPFPLCAEGFRLLTLYLNLIRGKEGKHVLSIESPGVDGMLGEEEELGGMTYHPGLKASCSLTHL